MNQIAQIVLTAEDLLFLLKCDPETGELFWRPRSAQLFLPTRNRTSAHICSNWNSRYAGKPAFTASDPNGYKRGAILGRSYYAHRVIWAIVNGSWPDGEIDHINGNPSDNRLSNLRVATRAQNERNKGIRKNNTSGYKGVSLHSQIGKWVATITVGREYKHLGVFETAAEASEAYSAAAQQFHKEFARTS